MIVFKHIKILGILFLMSCLIGCNSKTNNSSLLHEILQDSKAPIIKKVLSDLNTHEVQILFTRIHRDPLGIPKFASLFSVILVRKTPEKSLVVFGVIRLLDCVLLLNTSLNKLHTSKYSPSLNFDEFPSNILCTFRSFSDISSFIL